MTCKDCGQLDCDESGCSTKIPMDVLKWHDEAMADLLTMFDQVEVKRARASQASKEEILAHLRLLDKRNGTKKNLV